MFEHITKALLTRKKKKSVEKTEISNMDEVVELLKKNIHDEIIADGQSEKYFENFWLVWWGMMGTDCKNGLLKTFEQIKK